ncbi:MAG: serine/threonine protein kinase [Lentisphaerales bacterium]|nr:serine/threonine protein kinase [Lentisphaerales bacterium]
MDSSFLGEIYDKVTEEKTDSHFSIEDLPVSRDRYIDLTLINQGGMKEIYSAQDLYTDRTVALAILPNSVTDHDKEQSFIREARLNAYLQHPAINRVYDIGCLEDGRPFFATKLLKGVDLGQTLNDPESSLTIDDLLDIFLKICEAVTYAHSHGVIHRDIKPENILIDEYNEVTLCDWGIAEICTNKDVGGDSIFDKDLDAIVKLKLPQSDGLLCGSPGYISPERYLNPNHAFPSMDIYSLGALLYRILTGDSPKDPGQNDFPVEIATSLPASLVAICQKALYADVEGRYESVDAMIKDIRRYRHGFATEAEKPSSWRLLKLLYLRNKLLFHAVAIIFLILAFSFKRITESRDRALVEKAKAEEAEEEISVLYSDLQEKERQNSLQYSRLRYEWALNKINNGLYAKGIRELEEALQLNPQNHQALRVKGLLRLASFDLSGAGNILKLVPGSEKELNFLNTVSGLSKKSIMKIIEFCDKHTSRSIYRYSLISGMSQDLDFGTKSELYRKYIFYVNKLKKIQVNAFVKELSLELSSMTPFSLGKLHLIHPEKLTLKASLIKDLETLAHCVKLREVDLSNVIKIDFKKSNLTRLKLQKLILSNRHKQAFITWQAGRKVSFEVVYR